MVSAKCPAIIFATTGRSDKFLIEFVISQAPIVAGLYWSHPKIFQELVRDRPKPVIINVPAFRPGIIRWSGAVMWLMEENEVWWPQEHFPEPC